MLAIKQTSSKEFKSEECNILGVALTDFDLLNVIYG